MLAVLKRKRGERARLSFGIVTGVLVSGRMRHLQRKGARRDVLEQEGPIAHGIDEYRAMRDVVVQVQPRTDDGLAGRCRNDFAADRAVPSRACPDNGFRLRHRDSHSFSDRFDHFLDLGIHRLPPATGPAFTGSCLAVPAFLSLASGAVALAPVSAAAGVAGTAAGC